MEVKIRKIIEANYVEPPMKRPKLPEHLRTKHGLRMFLEDWKEKASGVLWGEWMTGTYNSYEDFVYGIEYMTPGRITELYLDVPEQLIDVFEKALGEVLGNMRNDIEEEIANREDEEW